MQSSLLLHSQIILGGFKMIVLGLILIMIAIIEVTDFITEKVTKAKGTAQRKAIFQSFYSADKSLKYLK